MRSSFLSLVFLCITSVVFSQIKITDSTIVKDSAGVKYPAIAWKTMLMQGYSLKPVDPKNADTEFLIYKLTEQQKEERLARLPKPRETTNFKTGNKISSFKTTDMNGNKIDLKELEGKIVVLNFWFINCHPCRMEIPDLNKLVDSFKTNEKVVFIAIALDEKFDLQKFLAAVPFKYQIVDKGGFIAAQYGIKSYPTHVIIDSERKIYFHTTGLATNTVYWLKKSIDELLAGKVSSEL
jgi:peroxiredoxin